MSDRNRATCCWRVALGAALAVGWGVQPLLATITFVNGVGDALVWIDPTIPEEAALLTEIEDAFKGASQYLWNATEQQHRFGNVRVIVPESWTDQPQYLSMSGIQAGNWDFKVITTSELDTSYESGGRVYLYRPQLSQAGSVIVHEMGHSVYGLGDEYYRFELASKPKAKGPWSPWQMWFRWGGEWVRCTTQITVRWYVFDADGNQIDREWMWNSPNPHDSNDPHNEWPRLDSTNPPDNHACIMWDSSEVINQFCGADTTDPNNAHTALGNTEQDNRHGHSCWDEMVGQQGLGRPGDTGTTTITYEEPVITFHHAQTQDPEIMLVLDRSGSMGDSLPLRRGDTAPELLTHEQRANAALEAATDLSHLPTAGRAGDGESSGFAATGTKLDAAKTAASQFVDLADAGRVGLAAYSSTASLLAGLTDVTVQANKDLLKAIISGLSAGGSTSIGAGLQVAYSELHNQGNPDLPRAIVLLTDGLHNTSPHPDTVMPSIVAEKMRLYTIGLGGDVDSPFLQGLAAQTSGAYYYSPSQQDLTAIYQAIRGQTQPGTQTVGSVAPSIPAGSSDFRQFTLDSSIQSASFTLTAGSTAGLDLAVLAPDGTRFDEAYAQTNPTLAEFLRTSTYILLTVYAPMPGLWTVESCNGGTASVACILIVAADAGIRLEAATSEVAYTYPDPIRIIARLVRREPIVLAAGEAEITAPDGVVTIVPLNDAGLNGDRIPYDGLYEGIFSEFTVNGTYTIVVRLHNQAGTAKEGPTGAGAPPWRTAHKLRAGDDGSIKEGFQREGIAPSVTLAGFVAGVDTMPPGEVTTLSADRTADGSIVLHWIAPGDDAYAGQAASYDVRWSQTPLNDANWNAASALPNPPGPGIAGVEEQFNVGNLPGEPLFFALRASDDAGNVSDLSNVAPARWLEYPQLTAYAGEDQVAAAGQAIQLQGAANGGRPPYTIAWSPAETLDDASVLQPTASPTMTTEFTLSVRDSLGQTAKDSVLLAIQDGGPPPGWPSSMFVPPCCGLSLASTLPLMAIWLVAMKARRRRTSQEK